MSADEIQLTLPTDDAFQRVAHLVLGGLASRHDLTVETLEDLTLALDTLLQRYGDVVDDVTLRVRVSDNVVAMDVGPFTGADVQGDLDRHSDDALDLYRILAAVCDDVAVVDGEQGPWIDLTKRVQRTEGEAA